MQTGGVGRQLISDCQQFRKPALQLLDGRVGLDIGPDRTELLIGTFGTDDDIGGGYRSWLRPDLRGIGCLGGLRLGRRPRLSRQR
jgi:hypothetical protein